MSKTKLHALRTTRSIALILLSLAGAAALSACNTTAGAGRDVKNLGSNIEDSANRNK
jgi:predicted small secreted protein